MVVAVSDEVSGNGRPRRLLPAGKMKGVAARAFFQRVSGQKLLQMILLLLGQDAAAMTEWAVAVHGGQQGLADKF